MPGGVPKSIHKGKVNRPAFKDNREVELVCILLHQSMVVVCRHVKSIASTSNTRNYSKYNIFAIHTQTIHVWNICRSINPLGTTPTDRQICQYHGWSGIVVCFENGGPELLGSENGQKSTRGSWGASPSIDPVVVGSAPRGLRASALNEVARASWRLGRVA